MPPRIFARGEKLEDGHYTVLEEIGVGGMGVVYHCRDELLLRDVAIKMLLPSLMADKKNVDVFQEEARLAAQLEHPNIVTVYDIGVETRGNRDHHFVAMEYLPGGNLAARVTQGPLPLEHSLNWMKQLSSGLSFAHKRGVIHQDIKADNIFITNEGDLKIGDFGLARLLVGRVYLNSATKGMGTPAYMSPELCRGEQQDHRSDIYSMGILFFEMCTGQLPYRAQGMIEMAMKHTSAPIPSARRNNPLVPEVLDRVIKRMMAKTPDERYRSMTEVLGIVDDLIFELRVARMGLSKSDKKEIEEKHAEAPKAAVPPPVLEKKSEQEIKNRDLPPEKPKEMRGPKEDTLRVDSSGKPPAFIHPERNPDVAHIERKVREAKQESKQEAKGTRDAGTLRERDSQSRSPIWSFHTKGPIGWSATPVLNREGNVIFCGSSDGRLYALATADGAEIFSYDAGSPILSGPVYTPDKLVLSDCSGRTHALNPQTGKAIWVHEGASSVVASPVLFGNTVVVCDREGQVVALDLRLGRKLWSFDALGGVMAQPKVHGDSLYFGTASGEVHSISCGTGRSNWKYVASGKIVSSPTTSVDTIYLSTQTGTFFALDAEAGRLIWEYPTGGAISRSGLIVFTSVMFASQDKWLYCCEKYDGTLKWKAPLKGRPGGSLLHLGAAVLTISREGILEGFDTTNGAARMKLNFRKEFQCEPTLSAGKLFLASVDGEIACIELSANDLRAKV